jgi:hypothetical protein
VSSERHLKADCYFVGQIVSLDVHRPDFQANNARLNRNRTLSYTGSWVYSKRRKLIVVARHEYHYVAIPLVTYGGKGLKNKTNKDEHVGIRDTEDTEYAQETESKHLNITVVRHEQWRVTNKNDFHGWFPSKGYVWYTFPIAIDYIIPTEIEGEIEDKDEVNRLVELYFQGCTKCERTAREQRQHDHDEGFQEVRYR